MSKSYPSAVQRYHDRVAPRYDHSYEDEFWVWHDALTWDYLKPFLPRDLSCPIVDLGCGTGKWAARLIKSGYSVTCVDISRRMLDEARRKIDRQGALARARFVHADLCDLSVLASGEYGFALALGDPIGCTSAPRKALKQIRKVLAADGVLVATFDNKLAALDYYLKAGDLTALRRFLKDGRTHWLTKDAEERFPITTFSPSEVERLFDAGGFHLLDKVGKTVLPMRHYRGLLDTSEARRRWAVVEKRLCRDPAALGRASHLQVAAKVGRTGPSVGSGAPMEGAGE